MRNLIVLTALHTLVPATGWAQFAPTQEDEPDTVEETPAPVLTKAPELVRFVEPDYPEALFAEGIEGEVALNIDISETGVVTNVIVLQSSNPEFEAPAVAAAQQFVFSPAEIDYSPSAIRIEYVLRFKAMIPEADVIAGKPSSTAPPQLPITFEGQVLEAGERRPLSGAEVIIAGNVITRTDSEGRFTLRGVPTGKFLVRIENTNFAPAEVEEERSENEKLVAIYYLRRISRDPFETVVR
ncbi:MAG: TonB family protein, partial [Myxococcota bacterium]